MVYPLIFIPLVELLVNVLRSMSLKAVEVAWPSRMYTLPAPAEDTCACQAPTIRSG